MALLTQAPKGTQDLFPPQSGRWQVVEDVMRSEAAIHGFGEVRTPVFEHTELFLRSVGDTTDVVEKQMYTFNDKGGRSITLRPEGTAGAVRAMLEHALYNEGLPVKLYYLTSCYRYEKPQAGRLREFHQFGVEMFGAESPVADAEVICLAKSIFDRLGVKNLTLELNSIGCPTCRAKYHQALKEYFEGNKGDLCETAWSATPCAFWTARARSAPKSPRVRPTFWTSSATTARSTLRASNPTSPPLAWNLSSTPPSCADWTTTTAPYLNLSATIWAHRAQSAAAAGMTV